MSTVTVSADPAARALVCSVSELRVDYARAGVDEPLRVIDGLSFEVRQRELCALIGPSGCGKTTLLHVIMGLLQPSGGEVARHADAVAMVFQKPQLLPWRSTVDNACFGLEARGVHKKEARARAVELLARVGLAGHELDYPHQLSEGMKQRVNLARALLIEPDLLLLDEPFAALDALTRRALHDDLLALCEERALTMLLVSHSLDEVAYLADRALILGPKPSRVCSELPITLGRPRGRDAEGRLALLELVDALHGALQGQR